MRKEIDAYAKQRVAEYYEQQAEDVTRRNFKVFFAALHKCHGHGAIRNARTFLEITDLLQKAKEDPVFWGHIDRYNKKYSGLDFPNENYEVMDE